MAARHPKQKRKAHSLSIRRTNSTEERPPPGILRGDMLEGQVSLGTPSSPLRSPAPFAGASSFGSEVHPSLCRESVDLREAFSRLRQLQLDKGTSAIGGGEACNVLSHHMKREMSSRTHCSLQCQCNTSYILHTYIIIYIVHTTVGKNVFGHLVHS